MDRGTRKPRPARPARRTGYVVAVVVNLLLLYVVNNLLAWEWPPFLTAEFADVLPIVNVSLTATVVANVAYVAFDPTWFKSLGEIGLLAISLIVTARIYRVFPFDFSAYEFAWDGVARTALVLALIAIVLALIVEMMKLARALGGGETAAPHGGPR